MSSKMVVDRQRSSESVAAAAETHESKMAKKVAVTFGDEDLEHAVGLLIDRAAATLGKSTKAMIAADDAHIGELAEDSDAREALEKTAATLHTDLVALRSATTSVLGSGYTRSLGFVGNTPDDPVAVERLGKLVAKNLTEVALPTGPLEGFTFDPKKWSIRLTGHLAPVAAARAALQREKRESETTLVAKQKAISSYDQTFSHTATLVSTFLAIAGETELARRVRPSTRKTGQTVEEAGDEGSEPGAAPGDGAPPTGGQ
jgi:hypothetical protein